MKSCLASLAACLCFLGTLPTAHGAIIASSTFNTNAEGWTVTGDGTGLTWVATGGNPGGHIRAMDVVASNTWFFSAPAKFLGNVSGAYGHFLEFDLRQELSDSQYNDRDIILTGGGMTLLFDTAVNPSATTFTSYDVLLLASAGWKFGSFTGRAATEAEMQTVLSSLTSLQIRGEYRIGSDTAFLDNVVLNGDTAVPEPTSLMIFGGVFGLLLYRHRRQPRRAV